MKPKYDVYISHAHEDKETIARPLRDMLMKYGISAFIDEPERASGADSKGAMINAMETANVALFVLSPEFVAREWPIKEILCCLRRYEESATDGSDHPAIIPFFYRLAISELYVEPRLEPLDKDGRSLYRSSRFFKRMERGEPEADIENIKSSLRKLHGIMGVENLTVPTNDASYLAMRRRQVLLQELCNYVRKAIIRSELVTRTPNLRDGAGAPWA